MSITNTVFKISADISKYKSDMQAAENVRKGISEKIAGYDRKEAQAQAQLSSLIQKRINKQKELDNAVSTGKPEASVKKLRNELARLSQQEDRLHSKLISNNKAKQQSYKQLANTAKTSFSGVSALVRGLGAGAVGTALIGTFNASIDKLDAIAKRARDIGISASAFQELQHQANLAGVPLEKLEVSLKKLITTTGKDARTAMVELAEKAQSGTLSMAEATRLFGENALEMIRILGQGKEAVEAMFNKNAIDEAARSAEEFKDNMEKLSNSIMPTIYQYAGQIAGALNKAVDSTGWYKNIAKDSASGLNNTTESEQNKLAELTGRRTELEDKLNSTSKTKQIGNGFGFINVVNPEYEKLKNELEEINNEIKGYTNTLSERIADRRKAEEDSAPYANKEKEPVNEIALNAINNRHSTLDNDDYDIEIKQAEMELKEDEKRKKREQDEKTKQKEQLKSLNLYLEELKVKTQIQLAESTGNKKLAEKIKLNQRANELSSKFGLDKKQAFDLAKAEQKTKQKTEYSDDEIAKAKSILARGEGGSIGKKTLADAQAIVDGKRPEKGFQSAMFKDAGKKKEPSQIERNKQAFHPESKDQQSDSQNKSNTKTEETKALTDMLEVLKSIKDATELTAQKVNNDSSSED